MKRIRADKGATKFQTNETVYNDLARLTLTCLLNNPKAFEEALNNKQVLSLRNIAYKKPKVEFSMARICKVCGGRIKIVDVDDVSITVRCKSDDCREEYQVEPDGLGEGGCEWAEAMSLKQEGLL